MKAGLLIIDVQNDFGEKGALPIKGSEEILPIINNIRSTYDKKFASVFLISDPVRQEAHPAKEP